MTDPHSIIQIPRYPLLVVVSGPSGVGKDSVIQALKRRQLPLHVVVTTTDRKPRPTEIEGVDYNFVSTERFEEMIRNDELIEYARVYNDYKGIPKIQIRGAFETGKDVIIRVDVQGAARLRSLFPQAVLVFLVPATMDELVNRLTARHSETPTSLARRIETTRLEMTRLPEFDYVVANPDDLLEQAVDKICSIIAAEHQRVNPRKITV